MLSTKMRSRAFGFRGTSEKAVEPLYGLEAGDQNSPSYNKSHIPRRVGNPTFLPAPENLRLSLGASGPFRVKEGADFHLKSSVLISNEYAELPPE